MQLRWLIGSRDWRSEEEGTGLVDVCMPDLPSLNGDSAALTRYARRMLRLIELHEPRLRQPRIELRRTGRAITPFAVVVHGLLGVVAEGESVRFEYEPGPRHSL